MREFKDQVYIESGLTMYNSTFYLDIVRPALLCIYEVIKEVEDPAMY